MKYLENIKRVQTLEVAVFASPKKILLLYYNLNLKFSINLPDYVKKVFEFVARSHSYQYQI